MVDLLVFATIIGSLIPGVPVPSSLVPTHNATITGLPRMPFGDLGRTFASYVGELLPTGNVPLALPDFWSSKPPVRRTVCTTHGLRLAATPAQCLAIVSAQLGIPPPMDPTLSPPMALLTLPAPRPLLALPAAPRPVILALPAAVHVPILMLPAPKHIPVLTLPAPRPVLTLSGPPDLIPAPAVFLPAIDDLYVLPFPTSVAHAAQPSWKVPADLLWSVSGARNVFATKYVVDARKMVTVLVMGCLIMLTWCWMLACVKEDVLDLAENFGWLVRCVWVGPLQDSMLVRLGLGNDGAGWTGTDAPDGLDEDAFVSTCAIARRGPIPSVRLLGQGRKLATANVEDLAVSTEASVDVAGQVSPMSKDANLFASCGMWIMRKDLITIKNRHRYPDVSDDSTASNVEEISSANTCAMELSNPPNDISGESPIPTMTESSATVDQLDVALPVDNDTDSKLTYESQIEEGAGESHLAIPSGPSDYATESDDGSSNWAGSMELTASISSFEVALEAEHIGAEDALKTEDATPVLESTPEAVSPSPAPITPLASELVSDELRDNDAQDEGPEVGSSGPNPGLNDEEVTSGGRRRGKRGGRRVRKRRENALGGGDGESSAGVEGTGEVEEVGGDAADGDGVSERRERGFSSGIWFSHRRRREKRG
ncbi:hypothetical protein RhiJN_23788 [Ceratobasidium sp. AG-Ba]|nr:hypothetical protein RhiJN_23788 [Ceratobasidium sp. AG-Ba]